ncbi:MAG: Na+/H+ antiporter NhaA [Actinomycetota bacterium]|nr:Na+/H+ antiporter NhaA [Actinomycetota bacterium]
MSGQGLPTYIHSQRPLARMVARPIARFTHQEAAGGIVLLVGTAIALIWANSPWRDSYETFWHTHISIEVGSFHLDESLAHWVNDGLMAIFFFVVGLEIKREWDVGELRDRRAAMLPAVAALGGMVVPAAFFVVMNAGGPGAHGWGIPMATDIAFALGVLALLGRRVAPRLKVFLLTLAIVDDIGAILVIAIFYTEQVSFGWLALAAALVAATVVARRVRVWYLPLYGVLGAGVWLATLESGIHATIAGVVLGLLTPTSPLVREPTAERVNDIVGNGHGGDHHDQVSRVEQATKELRESVPVGERLIHALHPWSSFVIVPIFALANAGIEISSDAVSGALTSAVTGGVVLGLVGGKIVGITGATWLAVRTGLGRLPEGVDWRSFTGLASLAGIGFTVSLFITGLAFEDPQIVDEAKLGVLAASALAAGIGSTIFLLGKRPPPRTTFNVLPSERTTASATAD